MIKSSSCIEGRLGLRVEWRKKLRDKLQSTSAYGRNGMVTCGGIDIIESLPDALSLDIMTARGNISKAVSIGIPRDKEYLYELSAIFQRFAERAEGSSDDNAVIDDLSIKWHQAKTLVRNQRSLSDYLNMSEDEFAKEYNVDPVTLWLMGLETEVTLYTLNNRKDDNENVGNENKGAETTLS